MTLRRSLEGCVFGRIAVGFALTFGMYGYLPVLFVRFAYKSFDARDPVSRRVAMAHVDERLNEV